MRFLKLVSAALFSISCWIPAATSQASQPELVVDLSTEPTRRAIFQGRAAAAEGKMLFWGNDGRNGNELWITDGTPEGTRLWTEVCPGSCEDDSLYAPEIGTTVFDGARAYFIFNDGFHGSELWTADGTPDGTRLVADICPGPCGSDISDLTQIGDRLYFSADTDELGREPWLSDGTRQGTRLIADVRNGDIGSSPTDFLPFGSGVAFRAFTSEAGLEWWQSDGTAEGTRLVIDLCPGPCSAVAPAPAVAGDSILFTGPESADGSGQLLYRLDTDGSVERLANLCDLGCDSRITFFYPVGDVFYLAEINRLWRTDGTVEGTEPVLFLPSNATFVRDVIGLGNGRIVVNIETDFFQSSSWELRDDQLVGPLLEVDSLLSAAPFGSGLLLVSGFSPLSVDAWTTDGTSEGTELLAQLAVNDSPAYADIPVPIGPSRILLGARTSSDFFGAHLWRIDPDGSERILGSPELPGNGDPQEITGLGSSALFVAKNPDNPKTDLWAFDAADGTPRRLMEGAAPSRLQAIDTSAGPRVLLQANDNFFESEAWITDGTAGGTQPLVSGGEPLGWPREPISFNGSLFFLADLGSGQKIWRTDGTAGNTSLVVDIEPEWWNAHVGCGVCSPPFGPGPIYPRDLTILDSRTLAFVARQDESGAELWQSDGTAEGTRLVADLIPGAQGSNPENLIAAGADLWFTADAPSFGHAWLRWTGEGAPIPVEAVSEVIAAVSAGDRAVWLERIDGGFALRTAQAGSSLISTYPLPADTTPGAPLLHLAGRVYFPASDPEAGHELWSADLSGTPMPRPAADLWPGPRGSTPEGLSILDGTLYFSADDGVHGRELWRLLPDPGARPARLTDLAPGPNPSSPQNFALTRGETGESRLFFSADDTIVGRELWSLELVNTQETCVADSETLCLQDGRFRVTVRWSVASSGSTGRGTVWDSTDQSGIFTFFSPENLELVVKILDGSSINEAFWVFYGALSDVEYWIDIDDLISGESRTWYNPPGELCGNADTQAFPQAGSGGPPPPTGASTPAQPSPLPAKSDCSTDATSLCLLDRFEVSVRFSTPNSTEQDAQLLLGTSETGGFWFFEEANLELLVKVLDGRAINDRFWVYYGALSDVEYTIRVIDTSTGKEAYYHNPAGNLCGGADTVAFSDEP